MKHTIVRIIVITLITIGFLITFNSIKTGQQKVELRAIQIKDTSLQLRVLENKYDKAIKDKTTTEQQLQELQKEKQDLESQLQAKANSRTATAYAQAPAPVPAPVSNYNGSGDAYLDFIIAHESGGNLYSVNASSGACGLGQALPCSKLTNVCSLSDAVCQIQWVRDYCISRYRSTYNAYVFWINHSWY